jgi:hypothetical protein
MAYLTAAEVRSRVPALANATTYSDAELNRLVAEFEEIAELFRGVSFTPRTATQVVTSPPNIVLLNRQPVRSITSFTVDGDAGTPADVTIDIVTGKISGGGWVGAGSLSVTYTHGLDAPPAIVLRACAEYCRAVAFSDRSGQGRDVIAQSFDGGITRYSTPNMAQGRPTGFLEVDRLLSTVRDYRMTAVA